MAPSGREKIASEKRMTIQIHDTLRGEKTELVPLVPGQLGIYVCGPTTYDFAHVGNARPYTAFDAVVRYLRFSGFTVKHARNFTDVDDKIIRRAHERNEDPFALSARYIDEFESDMASLGIQRPDVAPKVSEHLPEIIALITELVATDKAYARHGDVYFRVRAFNGYGKLSHRNVDDLKSGARVEVDDTKDDPLDFALWKAAKPGEPFWESPWGAGRPGWHIECSAMSAKYLGQPFDVHAGGKDLVFPHHENEIAQSEAAHGKEFARYWIHNGFVTLSSDGVGDDAKISKSKGTLLTIRAILERFDGEALRALLLSTHYRNPLAFSEQALLDADRRVESVYTTLEAAGRKFGARAESADEKVMAQFCEAMNDDFNTAEALGRLAAPLSRLGELAAKKSPKSPTSEEEREARSLLAAVRKATGVLGLWDRDPAARLLERRTTVAARLGLDPATVETAIAERTAARASRDFARADAVRAAWLAKGVELMDTPAGTTWRILL